MKNYLNYIIVFSLGILFTNCSKKGLNILNEDINSKPQISFVASFDKETKSILVETGSNAFDVYWQANDELSVFGNGRVNTRFTTDIVENTYSAKFTGDSIGDPLNGYYYAVYPYNSNTRIYTTGIISTALPVEQIAREGTFAQNVSIAVARSSSLNRLAFKNICSGLRFKLSVEGVKSVKLESVAKEIIAGNCTVQFNSEGIPTVRRLSTGSSSITLIAPDQETGFKVDTWYYFVTFPLNMTDGYRLTFYKDGNLEGMVNKSGSSKIFTRSVFRGVANPINPEFKPRFDFLEVYYGKANSVIAYNTTSASIDVTPYFTGENYNRKYEGIITPVPEIAESQTPVFAYPLWRENSLTFDVNPEVSSNNINVTNIEGYGNALIGVYNYNNELLWSYHLWVTKEDPTQTLTYTIWDRGTSSTVEVMPFALGALRSVTSPDVDALGLYYQWGRKDPLGRASDYAEGTTTLMPMTKGEGNKQGQAIPTVNAIARKNIGSTTTEVLKYSMKNPSVYLLDKGSGGSQNNWLPDKIDYLWGNPSIMNSTNPTNSSNYLAETYDFATCNAAQYKTIFDPSPEGFMVAYPNTFTNFTTIRGSFISDKNQWNVVSTTPDFGYSFYYQGTKTGPSDFYIAAGFRRDNYGDLANVGISGSYRTTPSFEGSWTAAGGNVLGFSTTSASNPQIAPLSNAYREKAGTIRCIVEP